MTAGSDLPASQTERKLGSYNACMVLQLEMIMHSGLCQLIAIYYSLLPICIGSTTSTRRLCDLSSTGKFGRGEVEAKLSQGG